MLISVFFFFSSRRRHTRWTGDWSSDVCSSDLNEILGRLADVDPAQANQVYSEIRALKVELSFAVGGVKNHEVYFEHLGGDGGDPDGAVRELIGRGFGSVEAWRADLKATGMAGRGWAWTAYDWDEG